MMWIGLSVDFVRRNSAASGASNDEEEVNGVWWLEEGAVAYLTSRTSLRCIAFLLVGFGVISAARDITYTTRVSQSSRHSIQYKKRTGSAVAVAPMHLSALVVPLKRKLRGARRC